MLIHTMSAVDKGKVEEEVIDKALLNLFEVLCLGLFDGDPIKGKYRNFEPQDVCTSIDTLLLRVNSRTKIKLLTNGGYCYRHEQKQTDKYFY